MVRILSVANQKGGVSKTTISANLAACLRFVYGKNVLLVDIDPQGNATNNAGFGIDRINQPTIYEVLKGKVDITDAILDYKGVDALLADIALSSTERGLTQVGSEHRLRRVLQLAKDNYDYIIVDCPPSLGMFTVNAFAVSGETVIPVEAAYLSLEGLIKLSKTIETVKEYTNDKLEIRGVLFAKYNKRYNISKEMTSAATETSRVIGTKIFKAYIHRTITVDEAQAAGSDLIDFNKPSTAKNDYKAFTEEYLKEIGDFSDEK